MTYRVIKARTEAEKKKSFAIREEVFVKEQKVDAKDEFDDFEKEAHHFVALDKNNVPVGSARWRFTDKGIKLERFTVKKQLRRKGLGSDILKTVLEDIVQNAETGTCLYMHSQLDAVPLYAKFGFQKKGRQFEECGIMHYMMWKEL
ncbi:MAG: GNAT family N-acetyltransferase [Ekhidna sp.]|nr:GNAT family N-acetyltransferase [Ekhidna sp.]